jgi:hypothetical protein
VRRPTTGQGHRGRVLLHPGSRSPRRLRYNILFDRGIARLAKGLPSPTPTAAPRFRRRRKFRTAAADFIKQGLILATDPEFYQSALFNGQATLSAGNLTPRWGCSSSIWVRLQGQGDLAALRSGSRPARRREGGAALMVSKSLAKQEVARGRGQGATGTPPPPRASSASPSSCTLPEAGSGNQIVAWLWCRSGAASFILGTKQGEMTW